MPIYTAIITIKSHSKSAAEARLNADEDIVVQDIYEESELEEDNGGPYKDHDLGLHFDNYPGLHYFGDQK